jgi:hypothetical protein
MHIRVPLEISDELLEFARTMISPAAEPQLVLVRPEPGCEASDCFENVRKKVAREGGRIQFGWNVWEWPGIYLEAEHHAVYAPPDGSALRDITPSEVYAVQHMFVPDDSATYDFENEGVLRDNLRYGLVDDPLLDELFKAAARRSQFKNELPGVGIITIHASEDKMLAKLERRVQRAYEAIVEKYLPHQGP